MDILIRARDNASRTFRTVSRASEQAERSLQSLGSTFQRIQKMMDRGLALDVDTSRFERTLERTEAKTRTVKDRILSYLNQIRSAAERGAEFDLSVNGQETLRRVLDDIQRRVDDLDGTTAALTLSERGSRDVISALEKASRALSDLDGERASLSVSERGVDGAIRSLQAARKAVEDLDGASADVSVGVSGFRASEDALSRVRKTLDGLNGRDASVSVSERGSEAVLRALRQVAGFVDDLDGRDAKVSVSERGATFAMRSLELVSQSLSRLDGRNAGVSVSLSGARTVEAVLTRLRGVIDDLDERTARLTVSLRGAESAERDIADLSGSVRDLSGRSATLRVATEGVPISEEHLNRLTNRAVLLDQSDPTVEIETEGTGQSHAALAGLTAAVLALNATSATINARVNGFATSMAQMAAMERRAKTMSTRRYGLNFDSAAAILTTKALGDTLGMLQEFETTSAVIHAISVPAMIGALGGLATTLSVVAGAAGSAAIAIGQGLAGAMGSIASVGVLGGSSLAAFGVSVFSTLGLTARLSETFDSLEGSVQAAEFALEQANASLASATPGTQEYENALWGVKIAEDATADAQAKMAATMSAITPETFALGNAFDQLELAMIRAQGAIANRLAPDMMRWINLALTNLPKIGPHFLDMIGGMAGVVTQFGQLLTRGTQLQSLTTILMGVKNAGVPAMGLLTNSVLIFLNTFQATVPTGLRVLDVMHRATEAARQWTATGEGQQRIASVWAVLAQRAQQLTSVVANLTAGMWGVGVALNQSGTVDRMVLGMVRLTSQFRQFMSATGQGRQALTEFMISAQPTLTAMGSLVGTVVREIMRISGALVSAKAAGSNLPILAQLFYDVEAAVAPIGRLIEKNFVLMAPRIGPLIENMAKLAEVFLAPMPPLLAFLEVGNRFLDWFTSLEAKTQVSIAKFASWAIALKLLSGPIMSVVGFLGKLGAGVGRLAGFFTRAGGTVGTFLARIAPIATRVPMIGAALAALTGPAGLAVAAIAAIGIGAIALIAKWDRVREFFSGGQLFGTFVEKARGVAQAVQQFLIAGATRLQALWSRVFPVIQRVATSAFNGLISGAQMLWKHLSPAITDVAAGFMALRPVLNTVGALVSGLLLGAFKALWPVVKLVAQVIGVVLVVALRVVAKVFRVAATAIGWVFQKLQPLNPLINKIGQVIGYVFATVITGAVAKAIQIIAKIFPWFQRFGPAANFVKNVFQSLYKIGLSAFGRLYNVIARYVGRAVQFVTSRFGSMSGGVRRAFAVLRSVASAVWGAIYDRISTVVGQIVSYVVRRFTTLRNSVSKAFQAVRSVASSVWSSVYSRISSVVGRIVNFVTQRFNRLSTTTRSVFTRIRTAVTEAFERVQFIVSRIVERLVSQVLIRWNRLKVQTTSTFNRIRTAISDAWDRILFVVQRVVERLVSRVQLGWNKLKFQTERTFNSIRERVVAVFNRIVEFVRQKVDEFTARVQRGWDRILKITQNVFGRVRDFLDDVWSRIDGNTRRVLTNLAEWVTKHWNGLKTKTVTAFTGMRDVVVRRVEVLRDKAVAAARNLRARIAESWEGLPKMAREIFAKVSSAMIEKLEDGINRARSWLGSLMIAIGNVASAVGLDSLGGSATSAGEKLKQPITLHDGGVVSGGVRAMHNGGVVGTQFFAGGGCSCGGKHAPTQHSISKMISGGQSQAPVGGVSNGRQPRVVYGEQKRNVREYYIVPDRKDNVRYLKGAAHEMGYQVVGPGDMHGAPVPSRMGIAALETGGRYNGAGEYGIPGGVVSTTFGTMRDYGPHNAVDVAAADGTPIHAIYKGVVSAVGSGNTPYNIWADYGGLGAFYGHNSQVVKTGPVNPGDVIARVGNVGFSTGPHAHISVDTTAGGAMKGMWDGSVNPSALFGAGYVPNSDYESIVGAGGVSGGSGLSVKQVLSALWKAGREIAGIMAKMPGEGLGIPGQVFRSFAEQIPDKALSLIRDKAIALVRKFGSSGNSDSSEGGPQEPFPGTDDQKKVALWMAKSATSRGVPGRLPVMTALQESGLRNITYGDRDSVGYFQQRTSQGWGTVEQIMDPEYSLRKFLDGAVQYKGQFPNTPDGLSLWADEVQRSAFPMAYAKWYDAAAKLIGDPSFYSKGGIVPGTPGKETLIKAHAGERVLPREVVRAFDRYADQMARANRLGAITRQERAHRADEKRWKERSRSNPSGTAGIAAEGRTARIGTVNVNVSTTVEAKGATKEDLDRAMDRVGEKQARRIREEILKVIDELENDAGATADRLAGDVL